MRKTFCYLPITFFYLIFLFFAGNVKAQFKWEIQNPIPTGMDFFSISFFEKNSLLIGSSGGRIVKMFNTDSLVVNKLSETPFTVFNILYCKDSLKSWAISSKEVFRSIDGANTWQKINLDINNNNLYYSGVNFNDKGNGWLLVSPFPSSPEGVKNNKGYILQTSDEGLNWERNSNEIPGALIDLKVIGDSYLSLLTLEYISSSETSNYLYISTDGGRNWVKNSLPFNDIRSNGKMHFLDEKIGWIDKYKTIDGGKSWNINFPGNDYAKVLTFTNVNNGWALDNNSIWHTTDGGSNWIKQVGNLPGNIKKISMYDNLIGWVCGLGGTIYKTTDGGKNWVPKNRGVSRSLYCVDFIDCNNGWAVGDSGTIVGTTNSGKIWQIQNSGIISNLRGVDFIDKNTGWAVGEGYVLYTSNGGQNWIKKNEYLGMYFTKIQFVNDKVGWIVGKKGTVLKTSNGGNTWDKLDVGTTNDFWCAYFFDELNGWVGGQFGIVSSTTNGGKNWDNKNVGIYKINNIQFVDKFTGWLTNGDGTEIYKTIDGGNNWELIPNVNFGGLPDGFRTMHFFNKENGFGTSFFMNFIYETTNSGNNWLYKESFPSTCFNNVKFVNQNLGWGVGLWGSIVRFYKSDSILNVFNNVVPVSNQIVNSYPNPFNSSSTITFSLNSSQQVNIQVFNSLGHSVYKYNENNYSKGMNKVNFNGNDLPSGVYFIHVKCSEYQKTIKSVLLK